MSSSIDGYLPGPEIMADTTAQRRPSLLKRTLKNCRAH
jgi:hypothetical protein